jgi:NADPH2:quinone reductase
VGKNMKAVFVTEFGGLDKLRHEEIATPRPKAGEALVQLHASGVNFIDIYFRTGLYKAEPPVVLGMEGAGVVTEVGEGVDTVAPGDRVAYAMARGSYAEYAVVPAWQLVKLPPRIDFVSGAASMLQGMTAHYLTHSTYPLREGEICLVHAAAGGAGRWIVAAAKLRGARVIGTTSTASKAQVARDAGCDDVIVYTEQDFEQEVKRITDGRGVDVVYDSVGAATFEKSLNSLRPRGMMVSFGNASGPVADIPPLLHLARRAAMARRRHLPLAGRGLVPAPYRSRVQVVRGGTGAGRSCITAHDRKIDSRSRRGGLRQKRPGAQVRQAGSGTGREGSYFFGRMTVSIT